MPASASWLNRATAAGSVTNRLRSTLMATGCCRSVLRAAVDAGEGPLGEVEEDLAAAEEEARRVALLEPFELPAREQPLAEERPRERLDRAVLGVGLASHLVGVTRPIMTAWSASVSASMSGMSGFLMRPGTFGWRAEQDRRKRSHPPALEPFTL